MFFTYFVAQNGLSRVLAVKLLMAGVGLALAGLIVLLFPMLVASVVAAGCFVMAFILLGGAWKVYRSSRPAFSRQSGEERFEEAVWREIR